jgi:chromosome partitioning protein
MWARRVAWIATGLVAVGLALALSFWRETLSFVQAYDAAFKLVGLGIGPVLALLGFCWGLVDKARLKDLAYELGSAETALQMERKATEAAHLEVKSKVDRIEALQNDLAAVADAGRLWKLRKNSPFPSYRAWKYDPEGAKVVTFGLFKGGVGKTHLALNFAAYVSERRQKPVLLIDLDFQGSASVAILSVAGIEPVGSNVDHLFEPSADLATLSQQRIHLAGQGPQTALNGGRGLARAWLVPADYTLAQVESRLLIQRVIHDQGDGIDERYRLAHLLLNPDIRRDYALIIIDTPPRMTLGTVNAFVSSHFYVVPTILDRVSSEAVRPFLSQVESLKHDLELDLRLAGIVGTMTRAIELTGKEPVFWDQINETVQAVLGTDIDHRIPQTLPRKSQVTNNDDMGYFLKDDEAPLRERFYDLIFDELWRRIVANPNQPTMG